MNKAIGKAYFAPMDYLDAMLEKYKDGYPNKRTAAYFETMKRIRDQQRRGTTPPDEDYRELALARYQPLVAGVEYGYYTANIHYYLFEDCSVFERSEFYKAMVNRRILFFLKDYADPDELMNCGWFPLNFPLDYLRFLKAFNGYEPKTANNGGTWDSYQVLEDYIAEYGNAIEQEIVRCLRPIMEEYCDLEAAREA